MKDGPHIARIAAVIGDRVRAEVLAALMADRALTATELANLTGVTKQTLSAHLAQLVEARLVSVERQGRHRYHRLADPDVAHLLETLMGVAFRSGAVRLVPGPRDADLRMARVCYDHLAGELAVCAYENAVANRFLRVSEGKICLTPPGQAWLTRLGIDTGGLAPSRRPLCRACLDWSERRHHLAGALGAVLLARLLALGWAHRAADSRAVIFTAVGQRNFRAWCEHPGP